MAMGDWREESLEIYRTAFSELIQHWMGKPIASKAEFFVDDIKEALLDLKLAVMNDERDEAKAYGNEVLVLLAELRLRLPED